MNLLARRAAKAVEQSILTGDKDAGEFEGIINNGEIQEVKAGDTL